MLITLCFYYGNICPWGERTNVSAKINALVHRLIGSGTIEELIYQRQVYKQQQSNVLVERRPEKRYFSGVQDDRSNEGELWGLINMLKFDPAGFCTTDLLKGKIGALLARVYVQVCVVVLQHK